MPLTSQDVEGPRIKIERARKHIKELETQILAYAARKPYQAVGHVEPQSGDLVHRFKIIEPVPNEFAAIIGDAIHNLRSALDLLACACARANQQSDTKTYFPITDDLAKFKNEGRKKISQTSASVQSIIAGLKPYKGGDDELWRLHKLDLLDKHRLITPVFALPGSLGLGFPVPGFSSQGAQMTKKVWFKQTDQTPLSDGAELLRQKGGAPEWTYDKNPQFKFDLAFGDGKTLDYRPVSTLGDFVPLVEGIVEKIRANA